MTSPRPRIMLLSVPVFVWSLSFHASGAEQVGASPAPAAQSPLEYGQELITAGRVTQVHSPHLFTIERLVEDHRDMLVLAAMAPSGPVGATVVVRGVLRRFGDAELAQTTSSKDLESGARERFVGGPVLVASSVTFTTPGELPGPDASRPVRTPQASARRAEPMTLTLRPATLAGYIDELAGQRVRILNARVVGVFEPGAFLIEPATREPEHMGHRERILVLIDGASLRLPAEAIVASTVTVVGLARTLLGARTSAEVPWPSQLTRELIGRLEIRAAVLANSVQTPEGTELTDTEPHQANR